jgi:uncharacterized integral membrane protein
MKQDKNIDKFIKQNLSTEQPSPVFSSKVMQQINSLELENEKALSSLLQKHTLEEPSLNFTSNIMQEINASSTIGVYHPVISKKVWFIIFSTILFLVILSVFNFQNTPAQFSYLDEFMTKIDKALSFKMPAVLSSPILAFSMVALSSLLFLDRFLHRKKHA